MSSGGRPTKGGPPDKRRATKGGRRRAGDEGRATKGGRRRAGDEGRATKRRVTAGAFRPFPRPGITPRFTHGRTGGRSSRVGTAAGLPPGPGSGDIGGSHWTRIRQEWEYGRPAEAIRLVNRPEYRRGRRTLQSRPQDLSLPAGPRLRWRVHRRTHASLSLQASEMIASSRRSANMVSATVTSPAVSRPPLVARRCRPPFVARRSSPAVCRPPFVARR
jgi:hypothetical protein